MSCVFCHFLTFVIAKFFHGKLNRPKAVVSALVNIVVTRFTNDDTVADRIISAKLCSAGAACGRRVLIIVTDE
jgi:hypothetical protein